MKRPKEFVIFVVLIKPDSKNGMTFHMRTWWPCGWTTHCHGSGNQQSFLLFLWTHVTNLVFFVLIHSTHCTRDCLEILLPTQLPLARCSGRDVLYIWRAVRYNPTTHFFAKLLALVHKKNNSSHCYLRCLASTGSFTVVLLMTSARLYLKILRTSVRENISHFIWLVWLEHCWDIANPVSIQLRHLDIHGEFFFIPPKEEYRYARFSLSKLRCAQGIGSRDKTRFPSYGFWRNVLRWRYHT